MFAMMIFLCVYIQADVPNTTHITVGENNELSIEQDGWFVYPQSDNRQETMQALRDQLITKVSPQEMRAVNGMNYHSTEGLEITSGTQNKNFPEDDSPVHQHIFVPYLPVETVKCEQTGSIYSWIPHLYVINTTNQDMQFVIVPRNTFGQIEEIAFCANNSISTFKAKRFGVTLKAGGSLRLAFVYLLTDNKSLSLELVPDKHVYKNSNVKGLFVTAGINLYRDKYIWLENLVEQDFNTSEPKEFFQYMSITDVDDFAPWQARENFMALFNPNNYPVDIAIRGYDNQGEIATGFDGIPLDVTIKRFPAKTHRFLNLREIFVEAENGIRGFTRGGHTSFLVSATKSETTTRARFSMLPFVTTGSTSFAIPALESFNSISF